MKKSGIKIFSISAILILIVALSSCSPGNIQVGEIIATSTITLTPTLDCPETSIDIDEGSLTVIPNNIVFLIDLEFESEQVYEYGEYGSNKHTDSIFDFLDISFRDLIEPGDRFSFYRFGFRSYNDSRIYRYKSGLTDIPDIPSTPVPVGPYEPLPTYMPIGVPLNDIKGKNDYVKAEAINAANATQAALENQCFNITFNQLFQKTAVAWEAIRTSELNILHRAYRSGIDNFLSRSDVSAELGMRVVFEGLAHVSVDMENRCDDFERCILIIVDDLDEHRPDRPIKLNIDLTNVEVISIMPNCAEIFQPDCQARQNRWTNLFEAYGASSVIYTNGERLGEFLSAYFQIESIEEFGYKIKVLGGK